MALTFKYFVDINSITLKDDLQKALNAFAKDYAIYTITLTLSNPYDVTYTLQISNKTKSPIIFQGTIQDIVNLWNAAVFAINFVIDTDAAAPNPFFRLI